MDRPAAGRVTQQQHQARPRGASQQQRGARIDAVHGGGGGAEACGPGVRRRVGSLEGRYLYLRFLNRVCVCVYVYIYIYILVYIYIYILVYIYIYWCINFEAYVTLIGQ